MKANSQSQRVAAAVRWQITALVALGPFAITVYQPAMPLIAENLGANVATIQWSLSSYFVAFAFGQLFYGAASDRYGRKPVLFVGLSLFLAASIGCALAPDSGSLIAMRFFQGAGAAVGPAVGRALVRDFAAGKEARRLFALTASALALAPAFGPIVGGLVAQHLGWRATFWVLAGFAVLLLVIVSRLHLPSAVNAGRTGRLWFGFKYLVRRRNFRRFVVLSMVGLAGAHGFHAIAPFVFIQDEGWTSAGYSLLLAGVSAGFMAGTLLTRILVNVAERLQLIGGGIVVFGISTLIYFLGFWTEVPAYVALGFGQFLWLFGHGLIVANATDAAISPYPEHAGTASALQGFFSMCAGAAASFSVTFWAPSAPVLGGLSMLLAAVSVAAYMVPDRGEYETD